MDDMTSQANHVGAGGGGVRGGSESRLRNNGQGGLGRPAGGVGVVEGILNGANANGAVGAPPGAGMQQQQQQPPPPATPPPSSWASKVRAGLGSDSSPTLAGTAGVGGGGGGGGGGRG